jgi:hypothetical protein
MKPLKLYKVEPEALPVIHIAARSNQQAAEIFVTWEASNSRSPGSFSVELVRMASLDQEQQTQLQTLLAVSTEGIATFDAQSGWSIHSEGWSSFASGEEVR